MCFARYCGLVYVGRYLRYGMKCVWFRFSVQYLPATYIIKISRNWVVMRRPFDYVNRTWCKHQLENWEAWKLVSRLYKADVLYTHTSLSVICLTCLTSLPWYFDKTISAVNVFWHRQNTQQSFRLKINVEQVRLFDSSQSVRSINSIGIVSGLAETFCQRERGRTRHLISIQFSESIILWF